MQANPTGGKISTLQEAVPCLTSVSAGTQCPIPFEYLIVLLEYLIVLLEYLIILLEYLIVLLKYLIVLLVHCDALLKV